MLKIILLWLFLSISFACLTVFYLYYHKITKVVELPDLRGSDLPSAAAKLKKLGLKIKVKKSSSLLKSVPCGYIIAHFPPPGSKLRGGDEVELIVSTGKRKIKAPNLLGNSLGEARLILTKNHLTFGYLAYVDIEDIKPATIIAQNPMPGEIVNYGSKIDLLINRGKVKKRLLVPNFVGYEAAVANKLAAHLELNLIFSPYYSPEALVVEQFPTSDNLVEIPATVTLRLAIPHFNKGTPSGGE